ncbi:flagellar basal-body rod protein FlgF [Rhodocaloribacter litoris]|uniref:flagellar basal-body rod protein FlgF n=1 Tax=Rhodocaloribacter litoris TaxID=2558931 RepID=UPI0014219C3A|nr:flagellar basal-body rod protein FlgF [Rhodocaloribacter litoris]QXD16012.1 flagellar basal-body rod protein FlgF [Rhodocaloribacter litoris]
MLLRLRNSVDAMTRMMRQQERIANNLANANTVGYKQDRTFTEILNEEINVEGAPQSIKRMEQWADLSAGDLEQTGNPLDVAIEGEGFFVLTDETTGTPRYTRAGRFVLDAEGTLRDAQGHLVEGEAGPIQLPTADGGPVVIDRDGTVRVDGKEVGRLRIVTFDNPAALRRLDGAAFDAGGMEPVDVEHPNLHQGYLEQSNVDPLRALTEMIEQHRLFESQQRSLRTDDELLGRVTRELGRF